jgi:hypothetical protein
MRKKGILRVFIVLVGACLALTACKPVKIDQVVTSIEAGTPYDAASFISIDNKDAHITVSKDSIKKNTVGKYEIEYAVTNKNGKVIAKKSIFIDAVDTTPPEILVVQPVIKVGAGLDFDGLEYATATDAVDGDVSTSVAMSPESIDTTKPGKHQLVYTVTDSAGNKATAKISVEVLQFLSREEYFAAKAIEGLLGVLKNPDSLQVHSVYINDNTVKLDVSAQNGFGGMNRDTYYVPVKDDGSVDLYQFDDIFQSIQSIAWVNSGAKKLDSKKILEIVQSGADLKELYDNEIAIKSQENAKPDDSTSPAASSSPAATSAGPAATSAGPAATSAGPAASATAAQ